MLSKFAVNKSTKFISKSGLKKMVNYKVVLTPIVARNFSRNLTKTSQRTRSILGKNAQFNGRRNWYNNGNSGHQRRGYKSGTSTTTTSSSNMIGYIGIAALLGGGYILMNTLNMPAVVDAGTGYSQVQGGEQTQGRKLVEKPTISPYVQEYLKNVYQYVVAGMGLTGAAAVVAFKSGIAHRMITSNSMVASIGLCIGTIGTMMVCRSISPENTVAKFGSFAMFNTLMGVSLCTLAFFHPSVLMRAGIYTGGIFGALSFTAMKAKEDKFLFLGGPLMAGLMVIILSSFTGMFLPARFVKTLSVIEGISLYGGLAIFGGFLLYDTQKIMAHARKREEYQAANPYTLLGKPDYMNESISIYLDLINIFTRLVMILSNGNRK